jgi:hypothetical protein
MKRNAPSVSGAFDCGTLVTSYSFDVSKLDAMGAKPDRDGDRISPPVGAGGGAGHTLVRGMTEPSGHVCVGAGWGAGAGATSLSRIVTVPDAETPVVPETALALIVTTRVPFTSLSSRVYSRMLAGALTETVTVSVRAPSVHCTEIGLPLPPLTLIVTGAVCPSVTVALDT